MDSLLRQAELNVERLNVSGKSRVRFKMYSYLS